MLDLDDRRLPAAGEFRFRSTPRRTPKRDAIALELDRIGCNLKRIAAALQKARRYPD